jgi:hypothetical protein
LPSGSGQNVLWGVGREAVAIGMPEYLLIAAHLLVPGMSAQAAIWQSVGMAEGISRIGFWGVCDIVEL